MDTRKVYFAFRSYYPRVSATEALRVARLGRGADYYVNGLPKWRPTEYLRSKHVYGKPIERTTQRERWVENTGRAGLRFVGHCDELVRSIDHTGWHTDEYGSNGETYRGGVWQLPSRGGCALYVAGYTDPINEGAALIDFEPIYGGPGGREQLDNDDDATAAAYAANRIAELAAEKEREHQMKWQAARTVESAREEIVAARAEHSALANELREASRVQWRLFDSAPPPHGLCKRGYPVICSAIRGRLANLRDVVRNSAKEIRATLNEFGDEILKPEYQ